MEPISEEFSKVKDLGDGKYELTFRVEDAGDYALEILQTVDDKATNIKKIFQKILK